MTFTKAVRQTRVPLMLAERAEPKASMEAYWEHAKRVAYVPTYAAADLVSVQFASLQGGISQPPQTKHHSAPQPGGQDSCFSGGGQEGYHPMRGTHLP